MRSLSLSHFADPGYVGSSAEDDLVRELVRPLFGTERERLALFAFAADGHLVALTQQEDNGFRRACFGPELLRPLLGNPATCQLLVAHNHPSGDPQPSMADIDLTRRLAQAELLTGVILSDHLILTGHGHFSFRAARLL